MAESRLRIFANAVAPLLAVAGAVLIGLEWPRPWAPLSWAGLIAVAHLLRVPTRSGDDLYLGIAAAAAAPVLLESWSATLGAYALGLAGAWVTLTLRRSPAAASDGSAGYFLAEVPSTAAFGLLYFVMHEAIYSSGMQSQWPELLAVGAGALGWFVVGSVARTAAGYEAQRLALRYLWLRVLSDWPAVLSLFSTGALFALSWPTLRWWAAAIAFVPYAFSHMSFVRYADTRTTYRQTIRALARIPEVAGLTAEGHAARTAGLAVSIAKDLGMTPGDVEEVEYAALMHDIGRITLNEPAILKAGYTDEDIARWGAQIVAEAPYLDRVADYVLQQHDPYRRPGEERDERLPLPAKVIKVASAYDQAVAEAGLPPIEAIEVLHRGAAYDFDPAVVRSLRRVVARRGAIAV